MSGEPKTLTPAEALRRLREEGMELTFDSNDATPWAVYRERGGILPEYLHFGQTQEEVLSATLGVPVVARDEAAELRAGFDKMVYRLDAALKETAELRAATTRLLAALDARDHFIEREEELPHDEWDIAFRRTGDDITNALAVLRRLAGGENEK